MPSCLHHFLVGCCLVAFVPPLPCSFKQKPVSIEAETLTLTQLNCHKGLFQFVYGGVRELDHRTRVSWTKRQHIGCALQSIFSMRSISFSVPVYAETVIYSRGQLKAVCAPPLALVDASYRFGASYHRRHMPFALRQGSTSCMHRANDIAYLSASFGMCQFCVFCLFWGFFYPLPPLWIGRDGLFLTWLFFTTPGKIPSTVISYPPPPSFFIIFSLPSYSSPTVPTFSET